MSSKYRILIVEDEEIECSALAVMLKYNRQDIQEIRTAANGIEALEIYRTFAPDIVLMDINLPGVNGLNVIRQMQMLKQNAYFVIVSAHSQFSYAQEAMRLDVTDFLVKPIRLEDINRVMNELVQQISHKRTQNETALRQQEKIEAIRPILERDCVLSVASMRSNTPIATIFDFMQIPVTFGFVFTVREKGMGAALLREIKSGMGQLQMKMTNKSVEFNSQNILISRCIRRSYTKFGTKLASNACQWIRREHDWRRGHQRRPAGLRHLQRYLRRFWQGQHGEVPAGGRERQQERGFRRRRGHCEPVQMIPLTGRAPAGASHTSVG